MEGLTGDSNRPAGPATTAGASPYTRADLYDHSQIAIEELDGEAKVAHTHRFVTVVRWTWPSEMDLLLRLAGFAEREITGGFDGRPVAEHPGSIVVSAWRDV